jgi:hypothetical protein
MYCMVESGNEKEMTLGNATELLLNNPMGGATDRWRECG